MTNVFIDKNGQKIIVEGIILAGCANIKENLAECGHLDSRIAKK